MDGTCRALSFLSPHHLAWREMAAPRIQHPQDAVVRPVAASTCDLDVLMIKGLTPFTGPFDLGHECVAEVVELGDGARQFHVGQLVAVSWHISCGNCHRCRRGLPNTCAAHPPGAMFGMNVGGHWGGMFSDLLRVPFAGASLLPLPPNIDPTHLASLSDNLPFGYELTVPYLAEHRGADVLVMGGVGSIALFAAAFAKAGGAGRVDYVDTDVSRLQIARNLGVNAIESPPKRRFGSYAVTVDASADAQGLLCAIHSTEPEGHCSSVGGHFADIALPIPAMYTRGIHLHLGRGKGRPHFEQALSHVSSGRVRPELIVTEVRNFDDAPACWPSPR